MKRLIATSTLLMAFAASVQAVPAADGNTWHRHESGTSANIISVSAVGDYAVASTDTGAVVEYRAGTWQPAAGWSDFYATSPFGTGGALWERNTIRVAALDENNFWVVSYAAQGNFVRYNNGTFSTYASGTGLRSNAITAIGGTLLIGRGNGGVGTVGLAATTPWNRRQTVPNGTQIITSVGGSSVANMWVGMGNKLWRSTNGSASTVTWTEQVLPIGITEGIRAIDAFEDSSAYFGVTVSGQSHLYRWVNGEFDETPLFSFGTEAFSISAIYARDMNNVWIAGSEGNLWYYDGTTATQIDLGIASNLLSISGAGNGIWVTGAGGEIFSTIAPIPEPGGVVLLGAAGTFFAIRWLINLRR